MEKEKILIVEDDKVMAFLLEQNLKAEGFFVKSCYDGESALMSFRQKKFDLCLIDVMLPKMDGFSLAKIIKKENHQIPLVFLTARNMSIDKLNGFKTGADDYVVKPFDIHELLFRIKAILRRTNGESATKHKEKKLGGYKFNPLTRELIKGEFIQKLSAKEADLLNLFIDNQNQILSRQIILQKVWGDDNYFNSKSMDVYLTRIRKIFSKDPEFELMNIHGTGYRFVVKG
jgi:two-component system, OmpR family, response regulator